MSTLSPTINATMLAAAGKALRRNRPCLARHPELETLAPQASEVEVMERLAGFGRRYGTPVDIVPLSGTGRADPQTSSYLITFEMTYEALAAARELKCLMVGFKTVMVSIRRPEPT